MTTLSLRITGAPTSKTFTEAALQSGFQPFFDDLSVSYVTSSDGGVNVQTYGGIFKINDALPTFTFSVSGLTATEDVSIPAMNLLAVYFPVLDHFTRVGDTKTFYFIWNQPDQYRDDFFASLLEHVSYRNTSDAPPSQHSLTFSIKDDAADTSFSSGAASGSVTVQVNTTQQDDPPGVRALGQPASFDNHWSVKEGGAFRATYVPFDPDGTPITPADLQLAGPDALLFTYDSASGTITSKVKFDHENRLDLNNDGVYEITLQTYSAINPVTLASITVTVTNELEDTSLRGLSSSVTYAENTVNATPQVLDSDVNLTIGDDPLRLSVTGLLAGDVVTLPGLGSGSAVFLNGSTVTYHDAGTDNDTDFATVISDGVGKAFVVDLTAFGHINPNYVDALIQSLTYQTASNTPVAQRTLVIDIVDTDGTHLNGAVQPIWTELTGSASPFNLINAAQAGLVVNGAAAPFFLDLDPFGFGAADEPDGRPDLLIGRADGSLAAFSNQGPNAADNGLLDFFYFSNPVPLLYSNFTANFAQNVLRDFGSRSAPTAIDLDGDGVQEVVVGSADGTLRVLKKNATGDSFTELTGIDNPFAAAAVTVPSGNFTGGIYDRITVDVGSNSTPTVGDLNGDGRPDVVIGADDGTFTVLFDRGADFLGYRGEAINGEWGYYHAYPTPGFYRFSPETSAVAGPDGFVDPPNPFAGFDVGTNSAPVLVDLDQDGRLDLVSGSGAGTLVAWRNTGSGFASFAVDPFAGIDVGNDSKPAFIDINGDGMLDLVVGDSTGAVRAWLNTATPGVKITVNVTAENDKPVLLSPTAVSWAETVTGIVYQTRASDPDGTGALRYVLGGADAARFIMGANGAISLNFDPDYEAPVDADHNNVYDLTLFIDDGIGATITPLTITITDVVEKPAILGLNSLLRVNENTTTRIDTDVTFVQGQSLDGTTLRVGAYGLKEQVSLLSSPIGPGAITTQGSNVLYEGLLIGTTINSSTSTFRVTFNAAATSTAVEKVIEALRYTTNDDAPVARRNLSIDLRDVNDVSLIDPSQGTHFVEMKDQVTNPLLLSTWPTANGSPTFYDLNGDGRLDLISGNSGRTFDVLQNVLDPTSPTLTYFQPFATNPIASIALPVGVGNGAPVFGDVTGDGVVDLVVGTGTTGLEYWKGLAAGGFQKVATATAFPTLVAADYAGAAPTLVNLDADAAKEIVVGTTDGRFSVFNWNGSSFVETKSALVAVVSQSTTTTSPGGGTVTTTTVTAGSFYSGGIGAPAFIDVTGDGVLDIVVGQSDGTLRTFVATDKVPTPAIPGATFYEELTGAANPFNGFDAGDRARPTVVDLDRDGRLDLVVGEADGVIRYFRSVPNVPEVQILTTAINDAPVFSTSSPTSVSRAEYLGGTTFLTTPVFQFSVTDPDSTPTYSLTGDDAAFFRIDAAQRAVYFASPTPFDFEAPKDKNGDNVYTFAINAVDGGGGVPPSFNVNPFGTISVSITNVLALASLTGLTPNFRAVEGAPAAVIDSDVTVQTDAAINNGTTTLQVLGLLAEDRVSLKNVGTGAGQVGFSGGQVTYGGQLIGTATGGVGNTFTVTLDQHNLTATTLERVVEALTYQNASATPTASRTLTMTIIDGATNSFGTTSTKQVVVDVTPVNNAPVITPPFGSYVSFAENGTGAVFQAQATDADGNSLTWSLLNDPDASYFSIDPVSGVVSFRAPPDFEKPAPGTTADNLYTILLQVSDGAATSGALVDIEVTNQRELPTLTGLTTALTVDEQDPATIIDPDVAVTPGDGLAGATITVSGLKTKDLVSIQNQGTGAGQIGFSAGQVTYEGAVIGTASGGNAATFTISLGAAATATAVEHLIEALTFRNTSNTPVETRTLTLDLIDSLGGHLQDAPTGLPIKVTVQAVNDAPTGPANIVLAPGIEDNVYPPIYASTLLAGWSDLDGQTLSVVNLAVSRGTLIDFGGGLWQFQPAENDDTGVTFTYGVTDGIQTIAATATLDLLPVNDAPSTPFGLPLPPVLEDTPTIITEAQLLRNWADPDGPSMSVTTVIASKGTVTPLGNGQWSYLPPANDASSVTFIYFVTDGIDGAQGGAVAKIQAVDDAPVGPGTSITLPAIAEDTPGVIDQADLLAGWTDIDSPVLNVVNLQASSGTLVALGGGFWSFQGAPNDDTAVSFTYQVTDGTTTVAGGTATLDLTPLTEPPAPPAAPVALPAATEDAIVQISAAQLLAGWSDPDTPALTVQNLQVSAGTVTDLGGGLWSFQGETDDDTGVVFYYDVTDGTDTVLGSATLDLLSVDDAPEGASPVILAPTPEDFLTTLTTAELLFGWLDPDSPTLSVLNLVASSGTLTNNGDGTWNFRGALDDDTSVSFTYSVTDGNSTVAAAATLDLLPVTVGLVQDGTTAGETMSGGADDDTISGLGGHDSLLGQGGNDVLNGGAGNDSLSGGPGNDSLSGGSGIDVMLGGGGADTLRGSADAETLTGGGGNDVYEVGSGSVVFEQSGGGIDKVRASISWTLEAEVENLDLLGAAAINGQGNGLNNTLKGNTAGNLLEGLGGDDNLIGAGGNDTLVGGGGADTLAGGAGNDVFVYLAPSDGGDRILAYSGGADQIMVSAAGFGSGLVDGVPLTAQQYVSGAGAVATQAVGQFLYDTAARQLWWDANGTTDEGGAVLILQFSTVAGWNIGEITVIA